MHSKRKKTNLFILNIFAWRRQPLPLISKFLGGSTVVNNTSGTLPFAQLLHFRTRHVNGKLISLYGKCTILHECSLAYSC